MCDSGFVKGSPHTATEPLDATAPSLSKASRIVCDEGKIAAPVSVIHNIRVQTHHRRTKTPESARF